MDLKPPSSSLASGGATRSHALPIPRMLVDNLQLTALHKLLAPVHDLLIVLRPIAHVDEDPAKRRVIITPTHDVNPLNSPLTKQRLEGVLDIAPTDVVESAGNANARLSNHVLVHVVRHLGV